MVNLDDLSALGDEEAIVVSETEISDKAQVAISLEGNDHIEHLVKRYQWFNDGIDAYKVAVSIALARGKNLSDSPPVTNKRTKYGISSLDGDGRLRDMIISLRPDLEKRPYAASEWLAEIGLMILRDELDSGRLLYEILMNTDEADAQQESDQ